MTDRYKFQPYLDDHILRCGESISLSAFERDANGDWESYDLLNYGDYVGDTVTRSNHRVFADQYGKEIGVQEVFGYPGYLGFMLNFDLMNEETREAIKDELQQLENYCVMSEDDLSAQEQELLEEGVNDYLGFDVMYKINASIEDPEKHVDYHDESFVQLMWEALSHLEIEVIYEDAVSAWIRDEDQEKMKDYILLQLGVSHG